MKRLLLLVAVTGFSLCLSALTFADDRPNIVFILADDVAWTDLGCYGSTIHDTPHLDLLARQGMRFTQAYAPAPICSASRAAIMTGEFPARLQFEFVTKDAPGQQQLDTLLQSPPFKLDLPLDKTTIAESLQPAGYATGFFGKWHISCHHGGYLGWSPSHGPLQQGFDEAASDFGSHPYAYRNNKALRETKVDQGEFPSDKLIDSAVQFIHDHKQQRFFLYLSHYYAHDPVHSRCEWLIDKYRQRLPEDGHQSRASYAAMIETMDHLCGRVLSALDEAQLTKQTIVVFTSDNGGHPNYTTNAPLRGSKWNLYEGGIRVPMIVRWPDHVPALTECDEVVHGCDLLPTFRELASVEVGQTAVDGTSLLPLFSDAEGSIQRDIPLVWHFPYYHPEKGFHESPKTIGVGDFVTSQTRPHSAIRIGDMKLLSFYEDERVELYDLASDIAEQHNLAGKIPKQTARIKNQLDSALAGMNARLPVKKSDR